jgi:hypothetical protein
VSAGQRVIPSAVLAHWPRWPVGPSAASACRPVDHVGPSSSRNTLPPLSSHQSFQLHSPPTNPSICPTPSTTRPSHQAIEPSKPLLPLLSHRAVQPPPPPSVKQSVWPSSSLFDCCVSFCHPCRYPAALPSCCHPSTPRTGQLALLN